MPRAFALTTWKQCLAKKQSSTHGMLMNLLWRRSPCGIQEFVLANIQNVIKANQENLLNQFEWDSSPFSALALILRSRFRTRCSLFHSPELFCFCTKDIPSTFIVFPETEAIRLPYYIFIASIFPFLIQATSSCSPKNNRDSFQDETLMFIVKSESVQRSLMTINE